MRSAPAPTNVRNAIQYRTHAPQQNSSLFDHFVGEREHYRRTSGGAFAKHRNWLTWMGALHSKMYRLVEPNSDKRVGWLAYPWEAGNVDFRLGRAIGFCVMAVAIQSEKPRLGGS
jgi:hypothetical protein